MKLTLFHMKLKLLGLKFMFLEHFALKCLLHVLVLVLTSSLLSSSIIFTLKLFLHPIFQSPITLITKRFIWSQSLLFSDDFYWYMKICEAYALVCLRVECFSSPSWFSNNVSYCWEFIKGLLWSRRNLGKSLIIESITLNVALSCLVSAMHGISTLIASISNLVLSWS